jgi:hypothetical protein
VIVKVTSSGICGSDPHLYELNSHCETTQMRDEGRGAALFDYTKLCGAVPGGQAEYLRSTPSTSTRARARRSLPGCVPIEFDESRDTSAGQTPALARAPARQRSWAGAFDATLPKRREPRRRTLWRTAPAL